MIDCNFWKGKKVFVTGHTGFKGSWLCLWLHSLGADVTGFSLAPPTNPSLFDLCQLDKITKTIIGDIRNRTQLTDAIIRTEPEIIIHMAAQPLVRASYDNPIETYEINVMGTLFLFEAVRIANNKNQTIKAIVNVTSDKCYENKEWTWSYREIEPMGGYDPYSNSKGCSELITSCYRNSFFNMHTCSQHGISLASARAGNVIGGGDWAVDRLVPDCLRSIMKGNIITIRNPKAIRPWQHVLEPLSGYLLLAQKLYQEGPRYATGWNFGPNQDGDKSVEWVVQSICQQWGPDARYQVISDQENKHEANFLKLDCSKAKWELGWAPRWKLEYSIGKTIEWILAFLRGEEMREKCLSQIKEYEKSALQC